MTTAIHDLITLRSLEFRQTTPQGSRSSESLSCGWSTGPVQARTGCDGDEAYYLVHDDSLQFAPSVLFVELLCSVSHRVSGR